MVRLGLADLSLSVWPLHVQQQIRALRLTVDEHDVIGRLEQAISGIMQVRLLCHQVCPVQLLSNLPAMMLHIPWWMSAG